MEKWKILKGLEEYFPIYPLPRKVVGSAYDDDELENQRKLQGKPWNKIDGDLLEEIGLNYSLLDKEALCYFTPGLFYAGLKEDEHNLLVFGWFRVTFAPRHRKWRPESIHKIYGSLSLEQLDILKECFLWLGEDEDAFSAENLKNCLNGIEELRKRAVEKSSSV